MPSSSVSDDNYEDEPKKSITLRIPEKLLKRLFTEAKEKKISLNALANQIFLDHEEWHAHATKVGMTYVSKDLLSQMAEDLTEQQIRKIAERYISSTAAKELILLLSADYNFDSALHTLRSWARASGFTLREQIRDNAERIVMQHDMGAKWSLLMSEIILGSLRPLTSRNVAIEIAGSTIVLTIGDLSTK